MDRGACSLALKCSAMRDMHREFPLPCCTALTCWARQAHGPGQARLIVAGRARLAGSATHRQHGADAVQRCRGGHRDCADCACGALPCACVRVVPRLAWDATEDIHRRGARWAGPALADPIQWVDVISHQRAGSVVVIAKDELLAVVARNAVPCIATRGTMEAGYSSVCVGSAGSRP